MRFKGHSRQAASERGRLSSMLSIDTAGDVFKIFGGVSGAIVASNAVGAWWRSGPGRRRSWIRNYRRLAPHVRPAYIEQLFGQPTFASEITGRQAVSADEEGVTWEDVPITVRVWRLARDGYLMTWSRNDEIVGYSLTTASRRFHPRIRIGSPVGKPHYDIRLGRTRFARLPDQPEGYVSWVGARRFSYVEWHYFGNPGGYLTWFCGVSDAGYQKHFGVPFSATTDDQPQRQRQQEFREAASVNSVLIASLGALDLQLETTGPDLDQVRLLDKPRPRDRWRIRWLERKL
jgi:hypothetical protein